MDTIRILISRSGTWLKLAYLLFVTGILLFLFLDYAYDDPFITYRYADNLRHGLGFVYNPGERVLSTTTPLFTILLSLLGYYWNDLQLLANCITVISIAISGLLFWDLGQTWKTPIVGWSGVLLYPIFPLLLSTIGSETALFLAIVLATFVLYARKKYGWAVLLCSMAILTRSDGILVSALLLMHYLWKNRSYIGQRKFWKKQPWGWILGALGLLIAWHGFSWIYFGDPLPITLAAKQAQGRMAISQLFASGMLRIANWYSGGWQYWVELGLISIGVMFAFLKKRDWLLILIWTGMYFLAYSLLGVPSYYWYYAPLVPGWVAATGLGIAFIHWLPLPEEFQTAAFWRYIRQGIVGLLLLGLFTAQVFTLLDVSRSTDSRYAIYRAVGEWLNENTPSDAQVGAIEVGIIGYYSKRPMVDFAGLIQPEVAELMQTETTYDDTAVWAVETSQPEYLVVVNGSLPRLESEIIPNHCQTVERFKGDRFNFRADMQVFYCVYQ